jgi:hypothetical protein
MFLRAIILCLAAVLDFGLSDAHAAGPEYTLDESPPPISTDAITSPIKKEFEEIEKNPQNFHPLRRD